jgi:AcrR family transcriptional regulator
MATPKRRWRVLELGEIVGAAVAIVDAEGLDALSMRRLARELNVGTMTLYHYVADKDHLAALVSEEIMGEMLIPGEVPGHWRDALREIAFRTRDVFLRHPWMADAFGQRHYVTPNHLRHVEQSIAAVAELDVDPDTAGAILLATDDYAIGHAIREIAQGRWSGGESPARSPEVAALIESGEVPLLARAVAEGADFRRPEAQFERGLEWLFDGFEAMLRSRRRKRRG